MDQACCSDSTIRVPFFDLVSEIVRVVHRTELSTDESVLAVRQDHGHIAIQAIKVVTFNDASRVNL